MYAHMRRRTGYERGGEVVAAADMQEGTCVVLVHLRRAIVIYTLPRVGLLLLKSC